MLWFVLLLERRVRSFISVAFSAKKMGDRAFKCDKVRKKRWRVCGTTTAAKPLHLCAIVFLFFSSVEGNQSSSSFTTYIVCECCNYSTDFFQQTVTLLQKNFLLYIRRWKSTLIQLAAAILIISSCWILVLTSTDSQ